MGKRVSSALLQQRFGQEAISRELALALKEFVTGEGKYFFL
jgi:hypothetical protein